MSDIDPGMPRSPEDIAAAAAAMTSWQRDLEHDLSERSGSWQRHNADYVVRSAEILADTDRPLWAELRRRTPRLVHVMCNAKGGGWHRSGHRLVLMLDGDGLLRWSPNYREAQELSWHMRMVVRNSVDGAEHGALVQWRCHECGQRNERWEIDILDALVDALEHPQDHRDGKFRATRLKRRV